MPEGDHEKEPNLLELYFRYRSQGDHQGASMVLDLIMLTGGVTGTYYTLPILLRLLN